MFAGDIFLTFYDRFKILRGYLHAAILKKFIISEFEIFFIKILPRLKLIIINVGILEKASLYIHILKNIQENGHSDAKKVNKFCALIVHEPPRELTRGMHGQKKRGGYILLFV